MATIVLETFLSTLPPPLCARAEQPADEAFLRSLFEQSRPLAAQLAHLPAVLAATVLGSQFRAHKAGLATQFPQAQRLILLAAQQPAGRLVFDDTGACVHIAEIALLPPARGHGFGSALLLALAGAAAPRGLSLQVAAENTAARRLYARLGFTPAGRSPGYVRLARRAGG